MATIEADRLRRLAMVRRLEAAGFRAWPATSTVFDGTWAVRLTTSLPAKRLNSVNPLDPSDHARMAERIDQADARFRACGRPLIFRQSPLAPPALVRHFDDTGWSRFSESIVLTADLTKIDLAAAVDRIPIRDTARYVEASLKVHELPSGLRQGLTEIVESIRPPTGLFIRESSDGEPIAVALAIRDNDLAGLLDLAVAKSERGQGIGRDVVITALRFAMHMGARTAWLQVESDNHAGRELYRKLGFAEAYRYVYRAPPAPLSS